MSRSSLAAYQKKAVEWYKNAKPRERLVVVVAIIALTLAIWDQALHWPFQQQRQSLDAELLTQQDQIQTAETGLQFMQQQRGETPADKRRRLAELKRQVVAQQEQLQVNGLGLISPPQMASVLKDILGKHRSVDLVRLQTQKPKPWSLDNSTASTSPDDTTGPLIYQHGLELELEGEYFSLLKYLKQIEQQAPSISWEALDYQVQTWPRARLLIRVHTLSLEEAVIGA